MNTCWQEEPTFRPEFLHLRNRLREFIEKEVMLQHVIKSQNNNLTMNTILRSADLWDQKTGFIAWELLCTRPVPHSDSG